MYRDEIFKHCVIIKEKGKSGPIGSIWEKLSDTVMYRKIYMGRCGESIPYEKWYYNPRVDLWEYHSEKTDFDVLSSFLTREVSV